MKSHPSDNDLALLAGGDCGRLAAFRLNRHLRTCADCGARADEFRALCEMTANAPEPVLNWSALEAEMRANIHLGLEAGECIRAAVPHRRVQLRMAAAFASLAVVIAAGVLMKSAPPVSPAPAAVLESTRSGLEVRSQGGSLVLLNHHGAVANQTVSAQGAIRARYIDGEAGTVTINNVYLE